MAELKNEELVNKYEEMLKERHTTWKEQLESHQRELIDIFDYGRENTSKYYELLKNGLKNGTYKKPSDFIHAEMEWLFDGYIYGRHKDALCHALDNSINCAYSFSSFRRSFRMGEYDTDNVFYIIHDFHREMVIDKDVCDILTLHMNDMERAFFDKGEVWWRDGCSEYALAYELDRNNEAVMDAVTDIINGDSEISLRRFILKGIVKSSNKKMHQLLGKLLLAARLQEGLRQSICECMDTGTVDAFKELLKVVTEHNLIRFSSVKRAVGTWLGLGAEDAKSLERISSKSIELIMECLEQEGQAKAYIESEDTMKIYIGLWSKAVYDVKDAMNTAMELAKTGTNHQVLTTGYFCANLDNRNLSHILAKDVIVKHKDSHNILAVYMPHFMCEEPYWRYNHSRRRMGFKDYFRDTSEAENYFCLLQEIYNTIPGKSVDFSPCIFPWYSASLVKSQVIEKMCRISEMLGDNEKKDYLCGLLKECDAYDRARCVERVLNNPVTPLQKKTVTDLVCDRESVTRKTAAEIVEKMDIEDCNYLQMEEMLKYKAADMRATIIKFLCRQEDEKILATIKRLLSDKKEEKRTAGLDIVMQLLKGDSEENNTSENGKVSGESEDKFSVNKKRDRQTLEEAVLLVQSVEKPTGKEQILIDNIFAMTNPAKEIQREPLYDANKKYIPNLPDSTIYDEAISVFLQCFPNSHIGNHVKDEKEKNMGQTHSGGEAVLSDIAELSDCTKDCDCAITAKEDCRKLHELFLQHVNDEYMSLGGEIYTFGGGGYFRERIEDEANKGKYVYQRGEIPGFSIWKQWYEAEVVNSERLLRMYISLKARPQGLDFDDAMATYVAAVYGKGFEKYEEYEYREKITMIVERLMREYLDEKTMEMVSIALGYWYLICLPQEKVLLTAIPPENKLHYCREREAHFISHSQFVRLFGGIKCRRDSNFLEVFPLAVMVGNKTFEREVKREESPNAYLWERNKRNVIQPHAYDYYYSTGGAAFHEPQVVDYIYAAYYGIVTKNEMYEYLFRQSVLPDALEEITLVVSGIREKGRMVAKRGFYGRWYDGRKSNLMKMYLGEDVQDAELSSSGETETVNGETSIEGICKFLDDIYEEILEEILPVELKRGDSETVYSPVIRNVKRIYGIKNFVAILTAMGTDTFDRTSYHSANSKKVNLSYLLGVCIPKEEETPEMFKAALSETDLGEKRLIEAAMYSAEWMDLIRDYLGYEGFVSTCYYFMAHMNETFDNKRTAMIAKYTPLTVEELNDGAFDIDWFKSAYHTMGEKRFQTIYQAAKYISDGTKHSRARKYADAVLGKMDVSDVENKISDKRNKDLVMAYSLIPLKDEEDLIGRYLFLQQFLKESKKFGAQRIASERKSVEISMNNLATNAGYSDVTRLTLRMETKLIDDMKELFEDRVVEDVTVRLSVDGEGKAEIICQKDGKQLKSVPAKHKKNEYIVKINESKKKLTQQYTRTKNMFEQAMEEHTAFTVEEIQILHSNPVANAIVKSLVFTGESGLGFLGEDGCLTDYAGSKKQLKKEDTVVVAHPLHLYKEGNWGEYQRVLFEKEIKQPFKQVFRELYVKTQEELELNYSRRYSGHQIQPQKTVACLKGRRWVADVEDGLQKIYYKENIIARIYAMADWFTPSDIEAPTLEWVEFSERTTGTPVKISDVPELIFSEVMRDVDLAVSVAHVGGVDPETSHSTVEMRAALLSFTLPLFKLTNVEITKNHAIVKGFYGTYDINLGSGIIHKQGGAMIHVLPVHSQHRGKLFLPFADDDPKTAEILTKVILFAQDKKIKDVSILEQIR